MADEQRMNFYQTIIEVAETYNGDGPRYWVHSSGPTLSGTIDYTSQNLDTSDKEVQNQVGLVDEEDGGMIAFGEPGIMEELCERLNFAAAVEQLAGALGRLP